MPKTSYRQLSESERHAMALALQQGMSQRAIATALRRSPSTISRECRRNAGAFGYASNFAQQRCERRRRFCRPPPKLRRDGAIFANVRGCLLQWWSTQQIARELKRLHPHDKTKHVSHESIYTCLYAQPRGALKKELIGCLRRARAARWPRSKGQDRRKEMLDLLSIHLRPLK